MMDKSETTRSRDVEGDVNILDKMNSTGAQTGGVVPSPKRNNLSHNVAGGRSESSGAEAGRNAQQVHPWASTVGLTGPSQLPFPLNTVSGIRTGAATLGSMESNNSNALFRAQLEAVQVQQAQAAAYGNAAAMLTPGAGSLDLDPKRSAANDGPQKQLQQLLQYGLLEQAGLYNPFLYSGLSLGAGAGLYRNQLYSQTGLQEIALMQALQLQQSQQVAAKLNRDALAQQEADLKQTSLRKNSSRASADGREPPISSQYRGVSWHRRDQKWLARTWLDGKLEHLGCFQSEAMAALAVDLRTIERFGEQAKKVFNFPDPEERRILAEKFIRIGEFRIKSAKDIALSAAKRRSKSEYRVSAPENAPSSTSSSQGTPPVQSIPPVHVASDGGEQSPAIVLAAPVAASNPEVDEEEHPPLYNANKRKASSDIDDEVDPKKPSSS